MDEFVIRRADRADAPALAIVGPAAYAESYGYLWDDPAGYAAQLSTFGQAAVDDLLGGDVFAFVIEIGGQIVGFLTMIPNSPDPIEHGAGGAEIARIYLLRPCRGRALGLRLLSAAETEARSAGCRYVWLDAMKSARWAWMTYERWGFRKIGEQDFNKPVSRAEKRMVVLRRDLNQQFIGASEQDPCS